MGALKKGVTRGHPGFSACPGDVWIELAKAWYWVGELLIFQSSNHGAYPVMVQL
jgi:hypothetical protein